MPLRPRLLADLAGGDLAAAAASCPQAVALLPAPEGDLLALCAALAAPTLRGALCAAGEPPAEARRRALRLALPPTLRRPLHPLLDPATPQHRFEVDGYRTKGAVVGAVALLAAAAGLRRRAAEAVEQALDELLLNALLDAPLDAAGRPRHLQLAPPERAALLAPPGERAEVRCGGDSQRFVIAVRDRFGSLRRGTVLAYLERCARARAARADPLEQQSGGSGVGLYLIASCCSELLFRLRRGRLTEVVCAVTTRPGPLQLQALYIDDDQPGAAAPGEGRD